MQKHRKYIATTRTFKTLPQHLTKEFTTEQSKKIHWPKNLFQSGNVHGVKSERSRPKSVNVFKG